MEFRDWYMMVQISKDCSVTENVGSAWKCSNSFVQMNIYAKENMSESNIDSPCFQN